MPENTKILNIQKLILLFIFCEKECKRDSDYNNMLFRAGCDIDKIFKADKFSDLDSMTLERLKSFEDGNNIEMSDILNGFGLWGNLLDNTKKSWLKKLGLPDMDRYVEIKKLTLRANFKLKALDAKISEIEKNLLDLRKQNQQSEKISSELDELDELTKTKETLQSAVKEQDKMKAAWKKVLLSDTHIDTMRDLFIEGLETELQNQAKKLNKIGILGLDKENTKTAKDDSILAFFNNKVDKCKDLDEIEQLLLEYTTASGCDLINGFLRGDLSTIKSKNLKLKASWGTSLNVSFNVLLEIVLKSLKLRNVLMYGTLDKLTTVYRGLSVEGFLKFCKIDKELEQANSQEIIDYLNKKQPLYSTNAITSTSTDKQIADAHAKGNQKPVLMKICLSPGVSFGKDFSDTSFGSDDYNKEVILKPNQKIKIYKASLKKYGTINIIHVNCTTI